MNINNKRNYFSLVMILIFIFLVVIWSYISITQASEIKIEQENKITLSARESVKAETVHNALKDYVHNKELEKERRKLIEKGKFETRRYFDSDVHVYISGIDETLAVTKGKKHLETLQELKMPNEVAKINLGFFNPKTGGQHGGSYLVNGKYESSPSGRYMDLHYYKNGRIDIINYEKELSQEKVNELKEETHFVVGTSYSLVQDGKKNLEGAQVFSHSNGRNPRTMFGQMADGRFVMAVVDGRKVDSKGVTADQSAEIMLELGCVEAVNMDGGGSSTLIVNNELKNTPSDGRQRLIGSSLHIIKK